MRQMSTTHHPIEKERQLREDHQQQEHTQGAVVEMKVEHTRREVGAVLDRGVLIRPIRDDALLEDTLLVTSRHHNFIRLLVPPVALRLIVDVPEH